MIEWFVAREQAIIQSLVVLIFIISLAQNHIRRPQALIFSCAHIGFNFFLSDVYGYYYFIFAAYWDMVIIMGLSSLKITSKLTVDLQRISLYSIILNAGAWMLWMGRLDLTPYVMSYALLYIWTMYVLVRDEGHGYRNHRLGRWADIFSLHNRPGVYRHI